jgi:hypothetical protein
VTGEKCIVRNFGIPSLRQMLLGRGILCEEDGLGTKPARVCDEFVDLNFRTSCVETTTGTRVLSGMILLKWLLNVCTLYLSVTCVTERWGRCRLSMPQSCRVQGQDKRTPFAMKLLGLGTDAGCCQHCNEPYLP